MLQQSQSRFTGGMPCHDVSPMGPEDIPATWHAGCWAPARWEKGAREWRHCLRDWFSMHEWRKFCFHRNRLIAHPGPHPIQSDVAVTELNPSSKWSLSHAAHLRKSQPPVAIVTDKLSNSQLPRQSHPPLSLPLEGFCTLRRKNGCSWDQKVRWILAKFS